MYFKRNQRTNSCNVTSNKKVHLEFVSEVQRLAKAQATGYVLTTSTKAYLFFNVRTKHFKVMFMECEYLIYISLTLRDNVLKKTLSEHSYNVTCTC